MPQRGAVAALSLFLAIALSGCPHPAATGAASGQGGPGSSSADPDGSATPLPPAIPAQLKAELVPPEQGNDPSAKSPLIDLMATENQRWFEKLSDAQPAPAHFIGYTIRERRSVSIEAEDGVLTGDDDDTQRALDVNVRVGTPQLDSRHQIKDQRAAAIASLARIGTVPFGKDPEAVRRALWLETDRRYREGLFLLNLIRTERRVGAGAVHEPPDFSVEKPSVFYQKQATLEYDRSAWIKKVRDCSRRAARGVATRSNCRADFELDTVYYVNSEGSKLQTSWTTCRFMVQVGVKADDGMPLSRVEQRLRAHPGRAARRRAHRQDDHGGQPRPRRPARRAPRRSVRRPGHPRGPRRRGVLPRGLRPPHRGAPPEGRDRGPDLHQEGRRADHAGLAVGLRRPQHPHPQRHPAERLLPLRRRGRGGAAGPAGQGRRARRLRHGPQPVPGLPPLQRPRPRRAGLPAGQPPGQPGGGEQALGHQGRAVQAAPGRDQAPAQALRLHVHRHQRRLHQHHPLQPAGVQGQPHHDLPGLSRRPHRGGARARHLGLAAHRAGQHHQRGAAESRPSTGCAGPRAAGCRCRRRRRACCCNRSRSSASSAPRTAARCCRRPRCGARRREVRDEASGMELAVDPGLRGPGGRCRGGRRGGGGASAADAQGRSVDPLEGGHRRGGRRGRRRARAVQGRAAHRRRLPALLPRLQGDRGRGQRRGRQPGLGDLRQESPLRQPRGPRPRRRLQVRQLQLRGLGQRGPRRHRRPEPAARAQPVDRAARGLAGHRRGLQGSARADERQGGRAQERRLRRQERRAQLHQVQAPGHERAGAGAGARDRARDEEAGREDLGGVPRAARAARLARGVHQLPRAALAAQQRGQLGARHPAGERGR